MERFTIGYKYIWKGEKTKYVDYKVDYETPKEIYKATKEMIEEEKDYGITQNGYYIIIDHLDGTHIYDIKAFKRKFNL